MAKNDKTPNAMRAWADGIPHNWTGVHDGLDFDQPSPINEKETLGQSLCRLGDAFYGTSQRLDARPNPSLTAQGAIVCTRFPAAMPWLNQAMQRGLELRGQVNDPFGQHIGFANLPVAKTVTETDEVITSATYGGAAPAVSGTSTPQVGHVSTTTYPDVPEANETFGGDGEPPAA